MALNLLLDELDDWLGDVAIKDTGWVYATNALSNLDIIFARIAIALAKYATKSLGNSQETLVLIRLAAKRVSPDSTQHTEVAEALQQVGIAMPSFESAAEHSISIRCSLER